MNLDLTHEQTELVETLQQFLSTLDRRQSAPEFDTALWGSLAESGFIGAQQRAHYSGLEAVFLAEEVSRVNGMIPVAVQAMITEPLLNDHRHEVLAICRQDEQVPVRYAGYAPLLVVVSEDVAKVYRVDPSQARPVKSNYVYPLAYPAPISGDVLAILPASQVRRRWQIGIGAEIVGAMDGAISHLTSYLATREQFGKSLGSFQAIQHRIAELAVSLECARYLVRDAAWHDDSELSATAAAYAATAAHTVCLEAHQLSGARGFTLEAGLYRWTLRLQMLSLEAGGVAEHAKDAAGLRWGAEIEARQQARSGTAG